MHNNSAVFRVIVGSRNTLLNVLYNIYYWIRAVPNWNIEEPFQLVPVIYNRSDIMYIQQNGMQRSSYRDDPRGEEKYRGEIFFFFFFSWAPQEKKIHT